MNNKLKAITFAIIISSMLTACGIDEIEVDADNVIDLTSQGANTQGASSQGETSQEETSNSEDVQVTQGGIYELYPIGEMLGKSTQQLTDELSEKYEIHTNEPDVDGYVKHVISLEKLDDSFKAVNIVTDSDDTVILIVYAYTKTISANYDEMLAQSVKDIQSMYGILVEQGEELPLIYTDLEIKEAGTIPQLVTDYEENSDFNGGNYESRFDLDGVEVEIGTLFMLEPTVKEGLYMETITFEPHKGEPNE